MSFNVSFRISSGQFLYNSTNSYNILCTHSIPCGGEVYKYIVFFFLITVCLGAKLGEECVCALKPNTNIVYDGI